MRMKLGGLRARCGLRILGLLALAAAVPACGSSVKAPAQPVDPALAVDKAKNPDARYVQGNIVNLRFMRREMTVTTGTSVDDFNEVLITYDTATQFYLDGQPASVDKIRRYMPVQVKGRMVYPNGRERDGYMLAEIAKFSSKLPDNVHTVSDEEYIKKYGKLDK